MQLPEFFPEIDVRVYCRVDEYRCKANAVDGLTDNDKAFFFRGAGIFYVKLENSAAWPDKSKLVADLMLRNQILASNITILSNICYYYAD